jgi:hypothetical protein
MVGIDDVVSDLELDVLEWRNDFEVFQVLFR